MSDLNYQEMERRILETAATGEIMTPNHSGFKSMLDNYSTEHQQALTCTLIHLVKHGYLIPLYDADGNEAKNGWSRGLSPQGYQRLRQLRHPVRTWSSQNWFPLSVALISALLSTASIAFEAIDLLTR